MKMKSLKPGFTLIELLVAMSITVILLGILVYMAGLSMDTYKNSRNEVRASRQGKEALEVLAKDFESMISRRDGNAFEWLIAREEPSNLKGPNGNEITNASHLVFFTGATDRYNGEIGVDGVDNGGDVSAVCYRLVYRDQISNPTSGTEEGAFPVFSLYRHLVNPDEAFGVGGDPGLLAENDLETAYTGLFDDDDDLTAANFLVENIYEFTVTFLVEVVIQDTSVTPSASNAYVVRATMAPSAMTEFRIKGSSLDFEGDIKYPTSSIDDDLFKSGQLVGVEVSVTVLTDQGLTIAKKVAPEVWKREMKKHSYHYTKTINTPRP